MEKFSRSRPGCASYVNESVSGDRYGDEAPEPTQPLLYGCSRVFKRGGGGDQVRRGGAAVAAGGFPAEAERNRNGHGRGYRGNRGVLTGLGAICGPRTEDFAHNGGDQSRCGSRDTKRESPQQDANSVVANLTVSTSARLALLLSRAILSKKKLRRPAGLLGTPDKLLPLIPES